MEGATGYDTEFVLAGEAVPTPLFGYARPMKNGQPLDSGAAGHVTGRVMRTLHYVPPKGGIYDLYNGFTGSKVQRPIPNAWLSLSDLENGDQAVWVGQAGTDGRFDISGVPDGDYTLTWWDEPQNNLLAFQQVTVSGGETIDMGTVPMTGWWTEYSGYVFNDANRNGVKDSGEKGVPNFTLTMRKRDNSLMDRGQTTVSTDANGYYSFEGSYPLGEFGWTVMEAYSDSFYTTGITYQADNQPTPTTVKGAGVDVSTLNIIGLGGTMDWGVHAYDPTGTNGVDPRNGGIVGSISYDTTRNELDPRYAAAEDWQPGVPNIPVRLYDTVACGTNAGATCDADDELRARGRRVLQEGQAAQHLPLGELGAARPAAPPATSTAACWSTASTRTCSPPTRRPTASASLPSPRACSSARRDRPGTAAANFGVVRQRQLRVRRRLLQRHPRRQRPGRARSATAASSPHCGARRLPGQPRHPRRQHREADVQGDRRGGHQHRQRQRDRPAGAPARLRRRRCTPSTCDGHRRPGRPRASCRNGDPNPDFGGDGPNARPQPDVRRPRRLALRGRRRSPGATPSS